jgi:hypothetical protein
VTVVSVQDEALFLCGNGTLKIPKARAGKTIKTEWKGLIKCVDAPYACCLTVSNPL